MCSGKFLWKTNQSYPRRGLLVGGISIHWTVGISMVHFLDRCGRVQTIWVVPAWEGGPGLCKKLPALSFCPGFLRWWTITCKANNSLSPSVAFGSGVYQSERVDCRNFQTAFCCLCSYDLNRTSKEEIRKVEVFDRQKCYLLQAWVWPMLLKN